MMVDLFNWITTYYGFEIEFLSTSFKEAQDLVVEGKVDGISSLFYSEERLKRFNFSEVIFKILASIFVYADRYDINSLNSLFYKKIAMQKGDYAEEFLRKNNIICEIIYVNDFYEAIDYLVNLEADAVIGDEQVVWYHIFNRRYNKLLKKIGEPLYVGLNYFGLNKERKELLNILNKGIRKAKELGVISNIEKKWIGYSSLEEEKKEVFKKYLSPAIILFLFLIFIIIFIYYYQARKIFIYRESSQQRLRKIIDSIPYIIYLINDNFFVEEINKEFIKFFNIDYNLFKKQFYKFNKIKNNIKLDNSFYEKNKFYLNKNKFNNRYLNLLYFFDNRSFANFYEIAYDDETVFKTGKTIERICEVLNKNNENRIINVLKIPIFVNYKGYLIKSVLTIAKDITNEKKTEEEIIKMQKLESIGLLAGKIAHDFNNLLTGIIGNLSLAKIYIDDRKELEEIINNALEVSTNAKTLTSQLLTFSKSGLPIKEVFDPLEIIKSVINFSIKGTSFYYEIYYLSDEYFTDYKNIEEKLLYDTNKNEFKTIDRYYLYADKNQFFQALNNIVINAIQANENKGKIRIGFGYSRLNKFLDKEIKENFYFIIAVEDEGPGIPESIKDKISEPFFTTKSNGNGLGLSSVKSIVKNHDGYLFFENKKDKGAIFYLLFPSTTDKVLIKHKEEETYIEKFNFNVVILDDDEFIINNMKKILKYLNCNIYIAKKDLELFNVLNNNKIDICILDLIIPNSLGGEELINILKIKYPQIIFVVSSGYSSNPVLSNYLEYGFDFILLKPYGFEEVKRLFFDIKKYIDNKNYKFEFK